MLGNPVTYLLHPCPGFGLRTPELAAEYALSFKYVEP
jgi:hypothetical protein